MRPTRGDGWYPDRDDIWRLCSSGGQCDFHCVAPIIHSYFFHFTINIMRILSRHDVAHNSTAAWKGLEGGGRLTGNTLTPQQ